MEIFSIDRKRDVPCICSPSESTVVESEAVKVMIKTMIKGNPFRKKVVLLKDAFISFSLQFC
jgi:hypothetical protein